MILKTFRGVTMSKNLENTDSRKFHIAIAVADLSQSVQDYSQRLACQPQIVIENEYALWRTDTLNFSIRRTAENPGIVRHLGWEDSEASIFTENIDCNGLKWERFNDQNQLQEIRETWPGSI